MHVIDVFAFAMVMVYVVAASLFLTGVIMTDSRPRKERKMTPIWVPIAPIPDSRSTIQTFRFCVPSGRWK